MNLLNPVSQVTGGGDRYMGIFSPMFPGSPRSAHLLEKSLILCGLGYLGVKGLRALQHSDVNDTGTDERSPVKGMKSRISTTMIDDLNGAEEEDYEDAYEESPERQKKEASDQLTSDGSYLTPASDGFQNALGVMLPSAALLGGIWLANRHSEKSEAKKIEGTLDDEISEKRRYVNRLIKARARLAKGNVGDAELADLIGDTTAEWYPGQAMAKSATFRSGQAEATAQDHPGWRLGMMAPWLVMLAAFGVGFVASEGYFSHNDPDNIKYRAAKKALSEYERAKTVRAPLNVYNVSGDDYFEDIDRTPEEVEEERRRRNQMSQGPAPAFSQPSARELPERVETRAPLAVTL